MFCFNLLAANNWQNADFADVVSTAAFSIAVDLRKGMAQDPRQILAEVASNTYVLWISEKLHQFPDLKGMVTPQLINGTMENLAFLNARRQEIANLKAQMGMGGFAPPQYQPQYPAQSPGYPPQYQPQYPQHGYSPQQGYQQPYGSQPYGQPSMGAPQYPGGATLGRPMQSPMGMGMGYPPPYSQTQGAVNKYTSQNAAPPPPAQYGQPTPPPTPPTGPATLGKTWW
jgi:hypothetical protein